MKAILFSLLCLSACAAGPPGVSYRVVMIPNGLATCSEAPASPKPLPRVTTPEAEREWGIELDRALSKAQAARNECAAKLKRLNELVGNDDN